MVAARAPYSSRGVLSRPGTSANRDASQLPEHHNVVILRGGVNPPLGGRCVRRIVAAPLRRQVLVSERGGGVNPPLRRRAFVFAEL